MSVKRARRVLLIAIALSLLIHFAAALLVRWPQRAPAPVREVLTLHSVAVLHITRRTPPPRPTPAPTVRASAAPRAVRSRTIHALAPAPGTRRRPPPTVPSPTPPPPATPSPAPSVAGCVARDAPPALAASPEPPQIPPAVRAAAASGTASVGVRLDPSGDVIAARLLGSSGSSALDAIAVQMARSASYTPRYAGCKGVASTYTFSVRFTAW